jgi:large subunit ribosomal protein L21
MNDYAIIELGGKQYRVEKGGSILVDRLSADEGAKVNPRAVMFRSGKQTVVDGSELEKVKVEAVVAEHLKGEKLRVFNYRAKKRYRRRLGHRSHLTRLQISDIKLPGSAAAKKKESADPGKGPDSGEAPASKQASKETGNQTSKES